MKYKKLNFNIIGLLLIGITITFSILLLIKNNAFKKYGSIDITYVDKDFERNYGYKLEDFLNTKKFKTITLTGNEKIDTELLKIYQLEIRKIVKSNDSINGVHLKLNNKTKYEEVIKAFEICEIEKVRVYVPNNYDIWVSNYATTEFIKKHPMKPIKSNNE